MGQVVGIDLGTTTSALSVLDALSRPNVVANADGEHIMPSAVYFLSPETILTGQEALNARQENVEHAVSNIKKHMGEESYTVSAYGKRYSPAEISSLILKKLIKDAAQQIGEITDVLITVPAKFEEAARRATINAGRMAGVNVIGVVNEPTAAAFYYAEVKNIKGKTLIFDFGGGTLDITLVEISDSMVKVVTSSGDRNLGGSDLDQELVAYFEEYYRMQKKAPLFTSDEERVVFDRMAEETKKSLSKRSSITQILQGTAGRIKIEVTREKYEELIRKELLKIEMLVEGTLEEAKETACAVEHVILVGGSTRIPAIQTLLKRIFGKEPESCANVDEVVSLGAALCAAKRQMDDSSAGDANTAHGTVAVGGSSRRLIDVCNHSYGTDANTESGLKNIIIIPKNTQIPCSISNTFFVPNDGQSCIRNKITQGEGSDLDFVTVIGQADLDLPPNTPRGSKIVATYSYDINQQMDCVFEHCDSGRKVCFKVDMNKHDQQIVQAGMEKVEKFRFE